MQGALCLNEKCCKIAKKSNKKRLTQKVVWHIIIKCGGLKMFYLPRKSILSKRRIYIVFNGYIGNTGLYLYNPFGKCDENAAFKVLLS